MESSPTAVFLFHYAIYIVLILASTTDVTDALIHPTNHETLHNFAPSQPAIKTQTRSHHSILPAYHNRPPIHRHMSDTANDPEETNNNNPPSPTYQSRSTANPEPTTPFSLNSTLRQQRLDSSLTSRNIDPIILTTDPKYRGTPALRAYTSFLLPKSEGAFAIAESPQRAAVVADNISFC